LGDNSHIATLRHLPSALLARWRSDTGAKTLKIVMARSGLCDEAIPWHDQREIASGQEMALAMTCHSQAAQQPKNVDVKTLRCLEAAAQSLP
jgi:hypothetical protein